MVRLHSWGLGLAKLTETVGAAMKTAAVRVSSTGILPIAVPGPYWRRHGPRYVGRGATYRAGIQALTPLALRPKPSDPNQVGWCPGGSLGMANLEVEGPGPVASSRAASSPFETRGDHKRHRC